MKARFENLWLRRKPNMNREPVVQCAIVDGTTQVHTVAPIVKGRCTKTQALQSARSLMKVHVHALHPLDLKGYRPVKIGIPANYKLATKD